MDSNDALVMVFSRNAFYRRLYLLALSAFAISVAVIGVLIFVLGYLLSNPTKPLYFAADTVGRLIQIVPVNTPNMTKEEVVDWAKEALQASFSYDFVNYREQLQDSQKYFTNFGWSRYMSALTLSGNLRALTTRKQIVSAQVVQEPTLTGEGLLAGAYAWKFNFLLYVTYSMPPYDGSNQFSNSLSVDMIVQRQPILSSYKGLGIVQLVSSLASTTQNQPPAMTTPTGET